MKYNVKTTGISLTPSLDQYIESKIKQIAKVVDPNDASAMADVEIGKISEHHRSGEIYRAEINLTLAHQKLIRAESTEHNLYNAINSVKEEAVRQVKSDFKKQKTQTKKGGRKVKEMLRGWFPGR